MGTRSAKKLLLNKETLRNLQDAELRHVVGGRRPAAFSGPCPVSGDCPCPSLTSDTDRPLDTVGCLG